MLVFSVRGDQLLFQNGDVLQGSLQSMDGQSLQWLRPDVAQPISFATSNLTRIDFAQHKAVVLTNACRVRFNNDDVLEGGFVSCDETNVVLDTWYAGTLAIPRKYAHSIIFMPSPKDAVFVGPTGLEGWTQDKSALAPGDSGQWIFRNGAFYARKAASIARDLKLPDVARIQFDLRWNGYLHTAIALYGNSLRPVNLATKENEPDFGGFYSLQIYGNAIDMYAITKHGANRSLGMVGNAISGDTNQMHVDLRVNKARGSISLFINDVYVKEWMDTNGFIGSGTIMRFVHQGMGALKLSDLRVTQWDGILKEKPVEPQNVTMGNGKKAVKPKPSVVEATSPNLDIVLFDGKPSIKGHLQSMANGQASMTSNYTNVTVALSDIKQIQFSSGEKPSPVPGQARGIFNGAGRITFRIEHWDKTSISATNAALGRIESKPAAFSSIQLKY